MALNPLDHLDVLDLNLTVHTELADKFVHKEYLLCMHTCHIYCFLKETKLRFVVQKPKV
jgi:hypothetical protein